MNLRSLHLARDAHHLQLQGFLVELERPRPQRVPDVHFLASPLRLRGIQFELPPSRAQHAPSALQGFIVELERFWPPALVFLSLRILAFPSPLPRALLETRIVFHAVHAAPPSLIIRSTASIDSLFLAMDCLAACRGPITDGDLV